MRVFYQRRLTQTKTVATFLIATVGAMLFASPACLAQLARSGQDAALQQNSVPAASSLILTAQILGEHKLATPGELGRLFFDRQTSRLLAECTQPKPYVIRLLDVSTSSNTVAGTTKRGAAGKREPEAATLADWSADVLNVDFSTRTLYWTSGTLWGTGGYLHTRKLFSTPAVPDLGEDQKNHLILLAVSKTPGLTYRVYMKRGSDTAYPGIAYVKTWRNDKAVQQTTTAGRGFLPRQIVYVPATNQTYLVFPWELRSLAGQGIALPDSHRPASMILQSRPILPWTLTATERLLTSPFRRSS